jgi:hypothetical protein
MIDLLLSTTLFLLAHHNADAGAYRQAKNFQLPPRANEWICRKVVGNQAMDRRDLCDFHGGVTTR